MEPSCHLHSGWLEAALPAVMLRIKGTRITVNQIAVWYPDTEGE
jgi:hypothetical protein